MTFDERLAVVQRIMSELVVNADATKTRVVGVTLGLPARIDAHSGTAHPVPDTNGWVPSRPIEPVVRERLGIPVHLENETALAALGELLHGAAQGNTDITYISLGTSITAGLITRGQLPRGAAQAGEIGHMAIPGLVHICRCGNRGCLDTVAAMPNLLADLHPTYGPDLTLDRMLELAATGDRGCQRAIADAGHHIGIAVAALATILNPSTVVIGGPLADAGEALMEAIQDATLRHLTPRIPAPPVIVQHLLGGRAALLGGLRLAASRATIPQDAGPTRC